MLANRKEDFMELSYYIMDPTGNITILVEGDVSADKRAAVAKELMKKEPTAEQVGFVGYGGADYDVRLDMAGGEFCGNATMSAAVLFAEKFVFNGQNADVIQAKDHDPNDMNTVEICEIKVLASGAEGVRKVCVEKLSDGRCRGTVEMPGPISIGNQKVSLEGREHELPVVDFGGITHVIVEASEAPTEPGKTLVKWCEDLHAECLGLMIYDSREKTLVPYVYVPKAGTLFRESSCASGTTAVGAYLAGIKCPSESACHTTGTNPAEDEYPAEGVDSARTDGKKDPVVYSISEPGGTLRVSVVPGEKYLLSGQVKINKHSMTAYDE